MDILESREISLTEGKAVLIICLLILGENHAHLSMWPRVEGMLSVTQGGQIADC